MNTFGNGLFSFWNLDMFNAFHCFQNFTVDILPLIFLILHNYIPTKSKHLIHLHLQILPDVLRLTFSPLTFYLWYFNLWHFYFWLVFTSDILSLEFLPLTFYLWHICLWYFKLWHFYFCYSYLWHLTSDILPLFFSGLDHTVAALRQSLHYRDFPAKQFNWTIKATNVIIMNIHNLTQWTFHRFVNLKSQQYFVHFFS